MALTMLTGKEVFVTAGSTRAYLDAVRFISNRSSGRLGSEIACECLRRGAYVTFFHGEGAMTPLLLAQLGEAELSEEERSRLERIEIETIPQLAGAIERELKDGYYDVAIHAMAVLDFVPDVASVFSGKTKSDQEVWEIKLVRTPKVIDMIKKISPDTKLVGFKLEADVSPEKLQESAHRLMEQSGAEIVVANDLARIKEGTYKAILIERRSKSGQFTSTEIEGRAATARLLCDRLEQLLKTDSLRSPDEGQGVSEE